MKRFLYIFLLVVFPGFLRAQTTVGDGGTYPSLFEAFNAINEGNLTGDVTLEIISNITETTTAVLYQTGYNGTADYTSVTMYPNAAGYTIDGDIDGPLIEFNGASNVVIDGRSGGASPDNKDLTIKNISTGTSASTIYFTESASSNTIRYCIIKGSPGSSSTGIVFFSTASTGNGNDVNTITYNDITYDTSRPLNAIYSYGSSGSENSGNTISNNNIYNFFSTSTASNGINLSLYSTSFTISGNSFYETTSFTPGSAVTYTVIKIDNTSGTGFTITGNYIGGQLASCGGSAWLKNAGTNNIFYAIYLNAGTGSASSIQNNTISNFNWTNSGIGPWTGIHIAAGAANIGTETGNTLGATTGTGSLTISFTSTGGNFYGINIASTGTVDCRNNTVGSVTVGNSAANASHFTGINKTSTSGTTTINSNLIGSTSTANSINASSASTGSAQSVYGINSGGTGTVTISSNTIANVTNSTTNGNAAQTGRINGILSTAGTATISSNTIHDLSIANLNNTSSSTASVCGLVMIGNTALKTVTGNTVYNLTNSNTSFAGSVIGLFFIGNTGSNIVSDNFIHSLSVASGSTANLYGIKISSGASIYSNNIVSLGGTTLTTIYGIYETGATNNNNNLYYNTVYIGGSVGSGTNKSYALYSNAITNTRNFRNNILFNARSTTGGANLHYAIFFVNTGGLLTCDYNDYYVTGTGGTLGYYGANKTTSIIVTGQDVSSFAVNPSLSSPGGTSASNYLASTAGLVAITGTGITADYSSAVRSVTYPSMGAWEYTVTPTTWSWTGATDTDWGTAANWNYGSLPSVSGNVVINDVTNDPVVNNDLTSPAECEDLTINTSAVLTIAAGKALKVNGTLTNIAGNTGLVIKSDANGNDGNLINNSSSVPATVELYLSGGLNGSARIYHYIVPPVQSMTIGTNLPYPTVAEAKTNLGITNFTGDLLAYSEVAAGANKDAGWQFFDGWNSTTGFSSLTSDRGYNINFSANDKMTFKGNLNGSTHNFGPLSFTSQGWNLVGNPYPCNYDLNGISLLTGSDDGVDNTIYFNHDGGYAYWNVITGGTTGYSDILPPMQGFFVHVTETGKTLNLPVSSKSGSSALPLRSKGASVNPEKNVNLITVGKIKLVLSKETLRDETIVCLIEDATQSFDSDYDAYKLFTSSTSSPVFYSELNSVKYAINTIQNSFSSQVRIPLTVEIKTAGEHKIDISEFENLDGLSVKLVHGTTETILSQGKSYTFTSGTGIYKNFELVLGEEDITTGNEPLKEEVFTAWYKNSNLSIRIPSDITTGPGKIEIYDLQGRPVIINNQLYLVPGEILQIQANLARGIYILNVTYGNRSFRSKIVSD
jgi:hypothetical protein